MPTLRPATPSDAPALLSIYAHYVAHTAITFAYEPPSLEEFRARMEETLKFYPYLVAEEDGRVLGYAYAGPFHPRAAYAWSCETTIYLSPAAQRRGLGRALYQALESRLRAMGVLNLYACIAYPEAEDGYLTTNSADFHAHLGFTPAGLFRNCGYKFGRWYHMVWMEKHIGEHRSGQSPVAAYPSLSASQTGD